jgi:hypothetical protein
MRPIFTRSPQPAISRKLRIIVRDSLRYRRLAVPLNLLEPSSLCPDGLCMVNGFFVGIGAFQQVLSRAFRMSYIDNGVDRL